VPSLLLLRNSILLLATSHLDSEHAPLQTSNPARDDDVPSLGISLSERTESRDPRYSLTSGREVIYLKKKRFLEPFAMDMDMHANPSLALAKDNR
jgi:hypothetical protein